MFGYTGRNRAGAFGIIINEPVIGGMIVRIVAVSRRILARVAMFSVAIIAINLLTLRYLVFDDIENADMSKLAGQVIAVDPGHGGIDGGANGNGLIEKNITLTVAQKLAGILEANGAKVLMTRTEDVDFYTRGKGGKRNDLLTRVDFINNSGANVFVSIHCNAIRDARLSGSQIFYHPGKEENRMIAETMQRALKNFPPGNRRQAKKDLDIIVLNATNIPGVLVEIGYLTNKREADMLADEAYQQNLAEHIAKALAYHFSQNVGR